MSRDAAASAPRAPLASVETATFPAEAIGVVRAPVQRMTRAPAETGGVGLARSGIPELGVSVMKQVEADGIRAIGRAGDGSSDPLAGPRPFDPMTVRSLNRMKTMHELAPRRDEFVARRNALVAKRFSEGLSRAEERQLAYVRWQLDRIDDAETGHELDQMERMVDAYERLGRDVQAYAQWITSHRRSPIQTKSRFERRSRRA